jgi:HEAT repeat protein
MITFYCPRCWTELAEDVARCPRCGTWLREVDKDEYAVKLIGALRHPEPTTAVRAAAILGALRERRAVQPLLALIASSRDPYILESAVEALGNIGDCSAIEGLSETLAHSFVRVRGKAAEALGKFQDNRARAALISALNDPSAHVRILAAEALTKLRHNEAVVRQPSHATPQDQRTP